jgi:hypothetical protein
MYAVAYVLNNNNNNNKCHLADAFIQSDLQSCVHTFYVNPNYDQQEQVPAAYTD